MDKYEELLEMTLRLARDYEEHGHSKELLRQCAEQQEFYDETNRRHRAMIDKWRGRDFKQDLSDTG